MAKLVDELLAYSKTGIIKSEIELESIALRSLTEEVVEREKLSGSKVRIEVDDDINVRANRRFLSRALSNVLQNAVRHGGEKGEILILASPEKENIVLLKIIDNGDGVPESDVIKIFDPLYRVEKDRARRTGGTGLGLAIVKTCIEACGGQVAARNLEPSGFEVSFVLMRVDPGELE